MTVNITHPNWCDHWETCENAEAPQHLSAGTTLPGPTTDVAVTVQLSRSDQLDHPNHYRGDPMLRLTLECGEVGSAGYSFAGVYLNPSAARLLANTLRMYADGAERPVVEAG
jgi:hypothetical protein